MLLQVTNMWKAVYLQTPLESAVSMLPACVLTVAFSVLAPICVDITRSYTLLLGTQWLGYPHVIYWPMVYRGPDFV